MCVQFSNKEPADIAGHLEPLVDDWLIDYSTNVQLRLHEPIKQEVVITTDKSWEAPTSTYFAVFQDGDLVRLYYRGFRVSADAPDEEPEQLTCYAESKDGIHFERPHLGLYEFQGSKENNIVYSGVEAHNFTPFLDTNPNAKPSERYKAVGGLAASGGLSLFISPDGLSWRKLQQAPIRGMGKLDSQNVVFWDNEIGAYRCFGRYVVYGGPDIETRAIWSMTSPDLVNWSEPQPHQYDSGVPLEQFYTNATAAIPNAPHILLSFPMRFVETRKRVSEHPSRGVSDAVFMSSRDGVNWDRRFREAWIRPGRDRHNWTDRSSMTARGIIQTQPDEYSLYVTENFKWPENRLRRYSIRRDGFASIFAGVEKGEWITRPLTFDGENLVLNYSTSATGSIQVEVQDETGQPIPGYELADMEPMYGDETDAIVCWKERPDLSAIQNRVVRFRFVMQSADLFSLHAREVRPGDYGEQRKHE